MNAKTSSILNRLLGWSLTQRLSPGSRYMIATLMIVTVGLIRALLITALVPWLLFMPAVLMIGLLLGRNPGIYGATLAAIVAGLSIGSLSNPVWLSGAQWIGSVLFLVIASGIAALGAELRAAFADRETAYASLAAREGFLASVLASSTDCIKVLDLEGKMTFMSEGGQKIMEVSDFSTIVGCPWPDFWHAQGNAQAVAAIEGARAGKASSFTGNAETMAGNMRWWNVAVSPIRDATGRPERILSVSRDITAGREQEIERAQLARIVENSGDFISMADLGGDVFFLNDAACRLVGLAPADIGKISIADFFPPEEAAIVRDEVLPAVSQHGSWSGERMFRHFATGELIPVFQTVFPVVDTDGKLVGYGTVTRDLRERKKAEEQQLLLNNELSHRLKNVLAVVQSVASQSLRQADDLASAGDALSSRLAALGQATDILTARSWSSASLCDLVAKALAPHGGSGDRITVEGPPIILVPEVTLALALALHELATNAVKYGALSNEMGRVGLCWSVIRGSNGSAQRFRLVWQEFGGPEVTAPIRRGFGSMMIERSLKSYFKGTALLEYPADGLVFTLDAPLTNAGRISE